MKYLTLLVLVTLFSFNTHASPGAEALGGEVLIADVLAAKIKHNSETDDYQSALVHVDFIYVDLPITEKIKASICGYLFDLLMVDGKQVDPRTKLEIEDFIYSASIEIKDIAGTPHAIVIGKGAQAFGQAINKMPGQRGNPIVNAQDINQVMGITLKLNDIAFFDLVEVSAFETKAGDLFIGDTDGASIRVTKNLTEKLKVQASASHQGFGELQDENRGSIGFIYTNGDWDIWAEGLLLDGFSQYPEAQIAFTAGVSKKIGKGKCAIQATYIERSLIHVGIGYEIALNDVVKLGAEVRCNFNYDGTRDCAAILLTKIILPARYDRNGKKIK